MKRAWLLPVLVVAAGLVWWLAAGVGGDDAPASSSLVQRTAAPPPPPAGFVAEAPPEKPAAPADATPLAAADDPQPAARRPPSHYAGIVVRTADGTLLPGVAVSALGADGAVIAKTVTEEGRFDFGPDVTTQSPGWLLCVWRDGLAQSRGDSNPREVAVRVDLSALTTPPDQIRVELDTGWVARGKVVDDEGSPITAASVMFREVEVARSRLDGTFVVRDLDPTLSPASFRVDGNGWVSGKADVAPPEPGKRETSFQVVMVRYVPPDAVPNEELPKRPPR